MMLVPACDPLQHTSMYQRAQEGHILIRLLPWNSIDVNYSSPNKYFCFSLYLSLLHLNTLTDSEDSDGEGGLGNVSRVIIRPPGHSGKAKRGHLCFDAAFETGNLGRADLIGEFEYDLFLRPDTCNPRYRFWFNFTVDNVKQDQVCTSVFLKLEMVNF